MGDELFQGKKILVIDDHPFFGVTIKHNFEKLGSEVETALDGFEGIEKAQAIKPDLIICDYIMPGKDGVQTVKELKAIKALQDVPVLMFTSEALPAVVKESVKAGAIDFITKTSGTEVMKAKIAKHLSSQKNEGKEHPNS